MESTNRKTNIFTSTCLILLALICGLMFSACGNNGNTGSGGGSEQLETTDSILSEYASYNMMLQYTENSTYEEVSPLLNSINQKVVFSAPNEIVSFSVLNSFRFTAVYKESASLATHIENGVWQGRQCMNKVLTISTFGLEEYRAVAFVKDDWWYCKEKDAGEEETKMNGKYTFSNLDMAPPMMSTMGITSLFSQINTISEASVTSVKKNGTNYRLTIEESEQTKVFTIETDSNYQVVAINLKITSDSSTSEMTFCRYSGNLVFPDLSDYVENTSE